jgi:hypothetical protein
VYGAESTNRPVLRIISPRSNTTPSTKSTLCRQVSSSAAKNACGSPKAAMAQLDERLHRERARAQPQCVAERSVRIRKAEEEVAVLILGRAGKHPAVPGEDVHLEQRFVHEPMPERRRFDPDPGRGAAERDRLELRDDRRHHAGCERRSTRSS